MMAPMKQGVLIAVLGGFFLGVITRSVADFGLAFIWFTLLLAATVGAWGYYTVRPRFSHIPLYRPAFFAALFFAALALGMLRTHIAITEPPDPLLAARIGTQVSVTGLIAAEPDERETSTRLTVELQKLTEESGMPLPVHGRVLIVAPPFPKLAYGDSLEIAGELQEPKNFTDDTGRVFNYAAYLAKDGVRFEIKQAHIKLVSSGARNTLQNTLFALKNTFLEHIGRIIPEPHASLLGGLLIGAKRSLGDDLLARFRAVGLIHIVVLSGYNISIVADAIARLTKRLLPRRIALILGALSIVLFALMTGGSATVVRASVMALIALLARATDRVYDITRALIFAGVAMTLHNPLILLFDPSFQLSFLATLALITLAPRLETHLSFVPQRLKLRETATATIATQIFVLPLLLFHSGELSVVSLPSNLLVLIAVPATMLFGFLASAVSLVSTTLASPLAWIATALLGYMLAVVDKFSSLPFASIALPPLSLWGVIAVYVSIFVVLMWSARKTPTRKRIATRKNF